MNISRVDLNLLVYLNVLLQEKSVTRAAEQLGITQPAMSNGLKRLRDLFGDPLLIRSSEGMTPTERALELQPKVAAVITEMQKVLQPRQEFIPYQSDRVFRIMASDYTESTLLASLVKHVRSEAPNVILDFMTPSDVSYQDMEQGKVDMAINRFDDMPQSFHSVTVWKDSFCCLLNAKNPAAEHLNLKAYLQARHIWVSKTGLGVGFGVNPQNWGGLGWIDQSLARIGQRRKISVFTRHYQMPALLAKNNDLIATLPTRIAKQQARDNQLIVLEPPFFIPEFELKMAWSPLLHNNPAHQWLRRLIMDVGSRL